MKIKSDTLKWDFQHWQITTEFRPNFLKYRLKRTVTETQLLWPISLETLYLSLHSGKFCECTSRVSGSIHSKRGWTFFSSQPAAAMCLVWAVLTAVFFFGSLPTTHADFLPIGCVSIQPQAKANSSTFFFFFWHCSLERNTSTKAQTNSQFLDHELVWLCQTNEVQKSD